MGSFSPINQTPIVSAPETQLKARNNLVSEEIAPENLSRLQQSRISRAEVITWAETVSMHNAEPMEREITPDRHYLRGPTSKATKSARKNQLPATPVVRRQKLLPQYPSPLTPLPPKWTLVELCEKYPNHLIGANLIPFLQHGWTASVILEFVRGANPDEEIPFSNDLVASRLRNTRNSLGSSLLHVINQKCEHDEGFTREM